MKKALVISSILITLPSYALCPLDNSGNTVCSEITQPSNSLIYEGNSNNQLELQPLNRESFDKKSTPNPMNNNSGCPFGICAQENKTPHNNTP